MKEFPLVLEASNREETNNWFFGDALLAECGPPSRGGINDGSYELLKEAAKFLFAKKGRVYTADYLSGLRITAHAFGKDVRFFEVPWTVYHVAGSPEYLKAIIDGAPKGTRVTYDYVEGIKRTQREHARAEPKKRIARRPQLARRPKLRKLPLLRRFSTLRKPPKRKRRRLKRRKLPAKRRKPRQKEHETKVAPKKKPGPPAKEEVPQLVAEMSFIANASRSVRSRSAIAERSRILLGSTGSQKHKSAEEQRLGSCQRLE